MSLVNKRDISFTDISRFLARNPGFFLEHPELLQKISIPHILERQVSSLLEYQVVYLQKQIRNLEKDNACLNQAIDEHRNLGERIHGFILEILGSESVDELYNILQIGLKKYYSSDRLVLLIFDKPGLCSRHADMHYPDSGSGLRFMFTEVLHRGKPLCNSLQEEHIEALFSSGNIEIQSTVILPMVYKGQKILMVLGSYDKNRYCHGIELDLLQLVTRIVNHQLSVLLTD